MNNPYLPPTAEVADIEPPLRLADAEKSLKVARIFCVLLLASYFIPAVGRYLGVVALLLYLLTFVGFHVFLGRAAALSGRSWAIYGLAPVLLPILGGIVSFGILRNRIPYAEV
jgi:hypothetical protein